MKLSIEKAAALVTILAALLSLLDFGVRWISGRALSVRQTSMIRLVEQGDIEKDSRLAVTYADRKVSILRKYFFEIENSGSEALRASDIVSQLRISFPGAQPLEASIESTVPSALRGSSPELRPTATVTEQDVVVTTPLLNKGARIELGVLVSGESGPPQGSCGIVGVRDCSVEPPRRPLSDSFPMFAFVSLWTSHVWLVLSGTVLGYSALKSLAFWRRRNRGAIPEAFRLALDARNDPRGSLASDVATHVPPSFSETVRKAVLSVSEVSDLHELRAKSEEAVSRVLNDKPVRWLPGILITLFLALLLCSWVILTIDMAAS